MLKVSDLKNILASVQDDSVVIFESHGPDHTANESFSIDMTEQRGSFFILISHEEED